MDWVKLYPKQAKEYRNFGLGGFDVHPLKRDTVVGAGKIAAEKLLATPQHRHYLREKFDNIRRKQADLCKWASYTAKRTPAMDMFALLSILATNNYGISGELDYTVSEVSDCCKYVTRETKSGSNCSGQALVTVFAEFIKDDNDTELLGYLYPKKDNTQVQEPTTNVQLEDTMNSSTTGTNNAVSLSATAAIKIESKLFVNGDDTAKMTDAHIIGIIAETEGHIRNLEAIENKGAKIKAKIEELKTGVAALNKLIDER